MPGGEKMNRGLSNRGQPNLKREGIQEKGGNKRRGTDVYFANARRSSEEGKRYFPV